MPYPFPPTVGLNTYAYLHSSPARGHALPSWSPMGTRRTMAGGSRPPRPEVPRVGMPVLLSPSCPSTCLCPLHLTTGATVARPRRLQVRRFLSFPQETQPRTWPHSQPGSSPSYLTNGSNWTSFISSFFSVLGGDGKQLGTTLQVLITLAKCEDNPAAPWPSLSPLKSSIPSPLIIRHPLITSDDCAQIGAPGL